VEKSTHKKRDRLGGNAKHTDCACAGSHLILMNEMIVIGRNGIVFKQHIPVSYCIVS